MVPRELTVVIPALDEQDAIRAIVERTLAAREEILASTGVEAVEIIVVSDGSSDRTPEIAREFVPDVTLISYRVNRGYGAAIKLGFRHGRGDLVGFLDADGTCDPRFFVQLIRAIEDGADIALGNRMTPASSMPAVRRLGNRGFALLLSLLSGQRISDSASGMRVLRRESLERIYPLPDGLHFTPAMSSRAALDPGLQLVEVDMPYAERTGESKLSVLRDGLRFAQVMFDIALTYRPFRLFAPLGLLPILVMGVFGADLASEYLRTRQVDETMVFRVMAIIVLAASGMVALTVGMLGERAAILSRISARPVGLFYRAIRRLTEGPTLFAIGALFVLSSFGFVFRPASEYLRHGSIDAHWSQVALAGFLFLFGAQVLGLAALDRIFSSLLSTERVGRMPGQDEAEIFPPPSGAGREEET